MRDPNLPAGSPQSAPGDATGVTVLAGGRVIDPASRFDGIADVVCANGRIVAVGPGAGAAYAAPGATAAPGVMAAPATTAASAVSRPPAGPVEVIDCTGLVVTPGLIDLHVHVYPGLGDFCVHPDRAGVEVGVPVVVDGGTSGVRTLGISRAFAQGPGVRTRVLAFMDPCLLYLATKDFIAHRLEIANDPRNLDLDAAAAAVEENRDYVIGFKVRATTTEDDRVSPFLEGAKSIAGDLPIMIHLGKYPYTKSLTNLDALAALRPGDIVTHAFRGHSGALVNGAPGGDSGGAGRPAADQVAVHPVFADAVARGVRLDLGHSGSDFRFAAARALLDLGYAPDTISTDLNLFNEDGPVYSLPETLSKIWALGVPLADVIAMATVNSAASIRRSDVLGTLGVGRAAEVSVLRVDEGPAAFSDGFETVAGNRRLAPVGCVRGGTWIEATGPFSRAAVAAAEARAGAEADAAGLPRRRAGSAAAEAAAESARFGMPAGAGPALTSQAR
ncbi:amidohydrolase/deacetylase family metallohydrolase [Frankia sp. AgB1.9]|uniref:amidohydrolase/deacetylase family metallohydrolase n=1 Tax=unclassified Frankia TaxID=2632575 RepID=UPI001932E327|nr:MULTISPECIES: amidohydrolase/deacetylase family metallohydrolase [unclassified Frankia]MBL7490942.1 amidohydrolase/deacetylase family metallohydrolase [Frankia sp. AgW1.1]MBL7550890.1 amidohydrolase/deacetylase family metallohydrolase [Frankia sp. AgB1.9]MBL7621306.1 amidohydrolase/deacetylase family metallohydrolase [Frankia sp. AgB1.8]